MISGWNILKKYLSLDLFEENVFCEWHVNVNGFWVCIFVELVEVNTRLKFNYNNSCDVLYFSLMFEA